MSPLVVIPARGGSKGLPGKNIKPLNGKPLIAYTIEAALELFPKELVCVSTDSEEIAACSRSCGANIPFMRPTDLASDTASSREVLLHALSHYENKGQYFDVVILLQPTSPFRNAGDIEKAVNLYEEALDMVVSVKEAKANPYFVLMEEDAQGFLYKSKQASFTRRQDCPSVYQINGAVYVINVSGLKAQAMADFTKVKKMVMDERSSHDIDNLYDWQIAECLISRQ